MKNSSYTKKDKTFKTIKPSTNIPKERTLVTNIKPKKSQIFNRILKFPTNNYRKRKVNKQKKSSKQKDGYFK